MFMKFGLVLYKTKCRNIVKIVLCQSFFFLGGPVYLKSQYLYICSQADR